MALNLNPPRAKSLRLEMNTSQSNPLAYLCNSEKHQLRVPIMHQNIKFNSIEPVKDIYK